MLNAATIFAASYGSGHSGRQSISMRSLSISSVLPRLSPAPSARDNGGNVQVTADSIHLDGHDLLNGGSDFLTGIQAVTTSFDSPAPGWQPSNPRWFARIG
jgi:hypothetical protein